MAPPYASYADLAAEQVEGVDYTRTVVTVPGASVSSIAIHGGAIEPGSGDMAKYVAEQAKLSFYEFAGIKASDNSDLHITSTDFDEPKCVALQAKVHRTLSFHGYNGTTGLAETSIGGLDVRLRDAIRDALQAAGFEVVDAIGEINGSAPSNICNRIASGAGVQIEMSRALRESFFPGGDLSAENRATGIRTQAFYNYANAIISAIQTVTLGYDDQLSRVQLAAVVPGVYDDFDRDMWGPAQNLNSGFETNMASWFATGGMIVRSTAQAHEGMASGLLIPDGVSAEAKAFNSLITITPQLQYRASMWVRCASARNVVLGIDWHQPESGGSAYISSTLKSMAVSTNTWTQVTVTGNAPSNAGRARITIAMTNTPPSTDLLYIDEAELRPQVPIWGVSKSGHQWQRISGTDSDYVVEGGVGKQIITATNNSRWCTPANKTTDWDFAVDMSPRATATGGSIFMGPAARLNDNASDGYLARLEFTTSGTINLTIRLRQGGSETPITPTIPTGISYTDNGWYSCRFQGYGATMRAKVWEVGDPEPDEWTVTTGDGTLTGPGRIGVRTILSTGFNGTLPHTVYYDNFRTYGTVLVERSINGIQWETARGGVLDKAGFTEFTLDDYEFKDREYNRYRVRVVSEAGAVMFLDPGWWIEPEMDTVWLKSLARPFLNRKVTVVGWSDITRQPRSGIFTVVGRSKPVVVTDLHGPRQWTLEVVTQDEADAANLDLLISTGEVQFVHVPKGHRIPGGYVALGSTSERRAAQRTPRRVFALEFTECAAPGPDVVPAVGTWATVLNSYATWGDVLDAHATWAELLQLVGSPEDVIVP